MSLRLSGLFIYPVKGARGIALHEAQISPRGLAHDRRFMVVDGQGMFLTQRQHPQLARLATAIHGSTLRLSSGELGALELPLQPECGEDCTVEVWRTRVAALDMGADAAAFCTRLMGTPARLVYMPDSTQRQVNPAYAQPGDLVSFADGFPFLLTHQASLDDLNARLEQPVPMDRFRPNLVVQGAEAYAEDAWSRLRIGDALFEVRKPSDRCVVITTDQQTGERIGKEPLKTLAGYHTWQGKSAFGQNLLCREAGSGGLRVGDSVVVLT